MAELVTIPISFFDLSLAYERPVFKLWLDRATVLQAVFDALKPWEPQIDDVEAVNTGKTSEQGVNIKLPAKRVLFFFGHASCRFTRENVDWQSAEETIALLNAALSTLIDVGGVALGPKLTTVSVHLQPKSLPFLALLSPFIPPQLVALDPEPVVTTAVVAKWAKRKVTIDGSGIAANAIFLRFEREFAATTGYEEMVVQLRKDQEDLYKMLGVEEDRG